MWEAPDSAMNGGVPPNSYNFYKGPAPGMEILFESGLTDTQFRDTQAAPGQSYAAYVTAVYDSREGDPMYPLGIYESGASNEATVTVPHS